VIVLIAFASGTVSIYRLTNASESLPNSTGKISIGFKGVKYRFFIRDFFAFGSPSAPNGSPGNGRYFPPTPARSKLPTLWIIGDSTVRNGTLGDGSNIAQWGWGAPIVAYFDLDKINVVNRAFGGTSSRSFYTGFFWQDLRPQIKKDDFVLLQFGANDNCEWPLRLLDPGKQPLAEVFFGRKAFHLSSDITIGWTSLIRVHGQRSVGAIWGKRILCASPV
jgi:hypothetical protein